MTDHYHTARIQKNIFWNSGDTGWTKVDLTDFNGNTRTDTVSVNGSYQENSAGTGNYTKAEQQYYPIRNDVQSDKEQTEKYRENIQNFIHLKAVIPEVHIIWNLQK